MDNSIIENAVENPVTKVKLCGKEYEFREPVKREATVMLGRALKIVGSANIQGEGTSIDDLAQSMDMAADSMMAVPEILDFVYDALKLKQGARNHIDANFDFAELMTAFQAIVERLQAPFVGGLQNSDPAQE